MYEIFLVVIVPFYNPESAFEYNELLFLGV
jgi:hypothetical protein